MVEGAGETNMNYKDYVIEKLKKYKKGDIIITYHAKFQAEFRQISVEEVKDNLINPKRLVSAVKEEAKHENEEKFDCLFDYGKNTAHRYIITINSRVIIVTVIKINRKWQYLVERHAKV